MLAGSLPMESLASTRDLDQGHVLKVLSGLGLELLDEAPCFFFDDGRHVYSSYSIMT
jgi:hypothetical protein